MAQLVLRPYATALFDLAKEQNQVVEFEEQVKVVIETIEENPQFMDLLLHPKIIVDEKIQLIDTVFSGKVADEITGILTIIVKKGRQNVLINILQLFLEMVSEDQGVIKATITSAVELNNEQLAQIKGKIENSTKKDVKLHAEVNQDLIGGMIIRVGDKVVDASIAGRLQTLKEGLTNLRLA
ncbi:MAG TPA: ATP synthase F1 subunit delta [Epulopiscium sp.]|nr:ATP synthase F1 subunit delta [Candidatus Epulonipiscium sp.]